MRITRIRSLPRRVADTLIASCLPGGRHVARVMWTVEGFLFPHEATLLYEVGRHASDGLPIVELGSMRGLSTCCLAAGVRSARRPGRVIAIDPHLYGSEPELRYNLDRTGSSSTVQVVVEPSGSAAGHVDGPLSAVFIDGAHDLENALADFTTWMPKVRPGGFVLIHDSTPLSRFPGPSFVADKYFIVGELFDRVGRTGSITWGRKAGGAGWEPRLSGTALLDALIRRAKHGRSEPLG